MTPEGLTRLKLDEGYARALPNGNCEAYPDPKSGGDPWTIGYGCTGANIRQGTVWTQATATYQLSLRTGALEAQLARDEPWFGRLDPVRRDVLVNIAYNVGLYAVEHWPTTLSHFAAGNWLAAAHDLRNEGQWNRDVGARAERLAVATETGKWA